MSIIATVAIVLFVSLVKQIRKGTKYQREAKLVAKDPLFQEKLKGLKGKISSVYTTPKFIVNVLLLIVILLISAVVFQKAE
jgi:type II secretory pathway component PulF